MESGRRALSALDLDDEQRNAIQTAFGYLRENTRLMREVCSVM